MNSSVSTEVSQTNNNSPVRSGANRLEAWVVGNSDWLALVIIVGAIAVRIAYAASCYLNPDEVQHFNAARPHTWLEAYRASTDLAHPPLFILALHAVLCFGNTEFIQRQLCPSSASTSIFYWPASYAGCRGASCLPLLQGSAFSRPVLQGST
jgi:hypothetical protein